jgi:hypothetical protein
MAVQPIELGGPMSWHITVPPQAVKGRSPASSCAITADKRSPATFWLVGTATDGAGLSCWLARLNGRHSSCRTLSKLPSERLRRKP